MDGSEKKYDDGREFTEAMKQIPESVRESVRTKIFYMIEGASLVSREAKEKSA